MITNTLHIQLTDADLAEIEALAEDGSNASCMCITSYHAPRLIAEVRALSLLLAEETAKHILTIESSADISRQLAESRLLLWLSLSR